MKKLKLFFKGLGFAVASSVVGASLDAVHQQVSTGKIDVGSLQGVAISAAVVGVLGYLKQSPLGKYLVEKPAPPDAE